MKKIARRRIPGAERLRMQASAPSVKACGEDAAAIEHEQIAGMQQTGKINKSSIFKPAAGAR
jgi:hypothetical protein